LVDSASGTEERGRTFDVGIPDATNLRLMVSRSPGHVKRAVGVPAIPQGPTSRLALSAFVKEIRGGLKICESLLDISDISCTRRLLNSKGEIRLFDGMAIARRDSSTIVGKVALARLLSVISVR